MNTPDNTEQAGEHVGPTPTDSRPLGYWLRVVDGLITHEFATAFEGEDVDRRDWMLLNLVSGDVRDPRVVERFARKGKGPHKGKRFASLAERGWIARGDDDTWTLTDEGRAAHQRLGGIVDGVRTRVASAVSPEDFATTRASLEAIARELGWDEQGDEGGPSGRGFRHGRRGFGPGRRHGFGHHGHPAHGHHGRPHHGHPHGAHSHDVHGADERAFERGFEAGFAQARDAHTS